MRTPLARQIPKIYERLQQPFRKAQEFLASFLNPAPATELAPQDFAHLSAELDLAKDWIGRALRARQPGVHILLYGGPGTGKTEFARLIAKEVQALLVEAAYEDEAGQTATLEIVSPDPLRLPCQCTLVADDSSQHVAWRGLSRNPGRRASAASLSADHNG